jgi:hypothetical protein
MTVWTWIEIGVAGALALSLFIGVATARILGAIGKDIAELLEVEPWTSAPLTRETKVVAPARRVVSGAYARDRRSHSART